ncbi:hypothetical protein J437_LFUL015180 [Ladona fulva]|uniref:PiggyBac transposable element-derived protein domain-containing protein n=1 Tax=Ladona fulva TaxID=123851 RepID=A0A8K0P7H4_LADFU|nr:hypothetical protein J437_LFUL015180 [Ladona fulva]
MSEHQLTSKGEKRDRKRKLSPLRSFPVEEIQQLLEEESSDDDFVVLTEEEKDESDNEDVEVVTQPDAALQSGSVVQLVNQLGPNAREQDVGSTNTAKSKDLPSSRTNIPFDGPFGMKTPLSEEYFEFEYFLLLFSDKYFDFIVKQTNDYAKHVLSQNVQICSRISLWKETTIAEMKVFIGELFLMGKIRVNRINDCWRCDYLVNLPFGQFMSRDCFLILLHFASERHSSDPIFRIMLMITYINNKMSEVINPSRKLTIDESMVLWYGRLAIRQYISTKHHKYGMKLYVLAEPNGLVQKIHLYGGSKDEEVGRREHSFKVVKKMEGKEGMGHAHFMDNFYNSLQLTEDLLRNKTLCTGTLQPRRKGIPTKFLNKKLMKGETICK